MADTNPNERLEIFCDGVFAIAITLLIIDLRIPPTTEVTDTAAFWHALRHIVPALFAFLLSFTIIFITWFNHHAGMKLVGKSSPAFIYANGLLLLGVVFIPFPTALLGEYLFTDHSSPAVILYSGVCAFEGVGWFFFTKTALNPSNLLSHNEESTLALRENHRYSYFAMGLYTVCAIVALWLPQPIAIIITASWVVWLLKGITIKSDALRKPDHLPSTSEISNA